jgi:hypothetical protein
MLVRLPPPVSLSSLSVSSVKLRILENFVLYLRNTWSLNLRAIESCVCSIRSIERKVRSILRTVNAIIGSFLLFFHTVLIKPADLPHTFVHFSLLDFLKML